MERMTLARALRYKKRVVETIRSLESDIQSENSVISCQERETDIRTAMKQREAWVKHLVDLKLAIQEATRPIQRLVLEMAEAKSEIAFWNRVDTSHGTKKDRYGSYGDPEVKVEAEVRKSERESVLKNLQNRIDQLQTKIDDHNASTMIQANSPALP